MGYNNILQITKACQKGMRIGEIKMSFYFKKNLKELYKTRKKNIYQNKKLRNKLTRVQERIWIYKKEKIISEMK